MDKEKKVCELDDLLPIAFGQIKLETNIRKKLQSY